MPRTIDTPAAPAATLAMPAVCSRYDLSPTAVYRLIRERNFPQPLKIGNRSYWIVAEIDAWFAERAAERDRAPADAAQRDDAAATDLRAARRRAGLASAAARRARREAAAAAADTAATA